ncbi:hypothetical protein BHM03_00011460 [Ensete ventricosum]|nr:hypothetical protein BHM03_00011460 [Ensete ventricosum]
MKSTTPIMEIDDDDRRPLLPVSISSQHFFAGWEPRRPSKIPTPESGLVDPAASKVNVVLLSDGLSSFCPLVFSLSPGLSCAAAVRCFGRRRQAADGGRPKDSWWSQGVGSVFSCCMFLSPEATAVDSGV